MVNNKIAIINGITEICLTKLDVLDDLKSIKVCTAYETPNGLVEEFPLDLETFSEAKPIYDELPGWETDISSLTNFDDLPLNAKKTLDFEITKEYTAAHIGSGNVSVLATPSMILFMEIASVCLHTSTSLEGILRWERESVLTTMKQYLREIEYKSVQ